MKLAISFVVTFALSAQPAFAIAITSSASAPTSNVVIDQTSISSYSNPEGYPFEAIRKTQPSSVSAWREVGQTFTVGSTFTLDKIALMVSQSDLFPSSGLSLYMDVWTAANVAAHSGTSLTGFPGTGIMPLIPVHDVVGQAPDEAIVWMTFDLPNVELTPGIYGFRLGFDTPDYMMSYQLGSSGFDIGGIYLNRGGDPYAGGQMFRFHPSNGSLGSGFTDGLTDLVFSLQSAPEGEDSGDFNDDGEVDAADYVAWRKTDSPPNGYELWYNDFGNSSPGAGGLGGPRNSAIPEPSSVILASTALLAAACRRRPRNRIVQMFRSLAS
jgi:hypothetical protein